MDYFLLGSSYSFLYILNLDAVYVQNKDLGVLSKVIPLDQLYQIFLEKLFFKLFGAFHIHWKGLIDYDGNIDE